MSTDIRFGTINRQVPSMFVKFVAPEGDLWFLNRRDADAIPPLVDAAFTRWNHVPQREMMSHFGCDNFNEIQEMMDYWVDLAHEANLVPDEKIIIF